MKKKQTKLTKREKQILIRELLEFWPLSIVVPGCIIAILVGVWMGV
jgi:hypothetical protein|tara:strand:+ start:213 stop:350 length:138 start_codon:yes stop_codon:yes gene_type:complete